MIQIEDILKGIKETTEVELLGIEQTVEIRRLSAGEIKRYDNMKSSGLKISIPMNSNQEDIQKVMKEKEIDINVADINEANYGATLYLVASGLSVNKKYTAKQVEKYIPTIAMIEDLENKILEFSLSGIDEMESFHAEQ